jgi:hypothetical protein
VLLELSEGFLFAFGFDERDRTLAAQDCVLEVASFCIGRRQCVQIVGTLPVPFARDLLGDAKGLLAVAIRFIGTGGEGIRLTV